MSRIKCNGVDIYYELFGDSQPELVLLHGHTLDMRVWDPVMEFLPRDGVLRMDLRGHGKSGSPEGGEYDVLDYASDVACLIKQLGGHSVTVAGFSLGGGIALVLALEWPELVKSLALISPVVPDLPYEESFFANLKEVARTAKREGIKAAMLGPWIGGPLFAPSLGKPGVREKLEAMLESFPGAEYVAPSLKKGSREWKVPDRLGEISVPTSVMVGADDMPGFVEFAKTVAASVPSATLDVVEGGGHLLPLETPEQVAKAISSAQRAEAN